MSDLRTRIAAVLVQAEVDWLEGSLYDAMTDAVIRELGLEREDGECGYCHAQLPGCRYVTEWETDD